MQDFITGKAITGSLFAFCDIITVIIQYGGKKMDPVKIIAVLIVIVGGVLCTQKPLLGLIFVALGAVFFFIGGYKKK